MRISRVLGTAAMACGLTLLAAPSFAHHSFSAEFDGKNCQEFTLVHKSSKGVSGEIGINRMIHDSLLDREPQIALDMTQSESEIHTGPAQYHAVLALPPDVRAFAK